MIDFRILIPYTVSNIALHVGRIVILLASRSLDDESRDVTRIHRAHIKRIYTLQEHAHPEETRYDLGIIIVFFFKLRKK